MSGWYDSYMFVANEGTRRVCRPGIGYASRSGMLKGLDFNGLRVPARRRYFSSEGGRLGVWGVAIVKANEDAVVLVRTPRGRIAVMRISPERKGIRPPYC